MAFRSRPGPLPRREAIGVPRGPKLYYAVPLLETWRWRREEFKLPVDWNLMAAATSSGLHYADSMIASEAQASNEKIAIDSLILCAGKSCVVLSKHSNEVVAVRAHRALSYLTKHNDATLTKKLRAVTFSRRECVLPKTLLPGSLHRGALRLPSVMYRLEMALLAAELRDAMDVPVSALKLLEALTSRACCFNVSYEPLELLGDSVLKIVAGTYVYATTPSMGSEELGLELYNIVCNSTLSSLALARNLYRYVFAEMFSPLKWISPGMIPAAAEIPEQLLSTKTLADVVEAVLGACVLEGELAAAMAAANWLQIPVRFPPGAEDHHRFEVTGCGSLTDDDLNELQEKLGYQFRNKQVLRVALSFHDDNFTFRRLEFLGDAVLDYLVTRHLVRSFPDQSAGRLNTLKQATINKEHYSCVSIRHGFHVYLQKVHFVPQIAEFAESLVEELARGKACSTFGISRLNSPKLLGDMIQTLAASIFIDSEYEPNIVWKVSRIFWSILSCNFSHLQVYERLLEPIATPENVMLHPVKQLETLCREQRLALDIQCTEVDGFIRADVVIDNERVSCCEHEEKRVARRLAAMQVRIYINSVLRPLTQSLVIIGCATIDNF
ncbi:endoribonuclease Dicer homolog 1-like isoform X2 [Selaginella moellendorffii]|uniref:endoribonuclease Dicer homolog 1-like isoform X2 n=1 Tax=Selaginella moellendorffii TaxID=88036 RepID=UPI000D1CAB71|nr:endoribonuclease Dicer homolog 1-like isoform X2 [Selaginella moellendorffii]|eukprot:XP_024534974.1 endoribonuclease Dicer homolog 1-like isoform X2 [Selaginella moellendorffii]